MGQEGRGPRLGTGHRQVSLAGDRAASTRAPKSMPWVVTNLLRWKQQGDRRGRWSRQHTGSTCLGVGAWGWGRRDFSPACGSGMSACVAERRLINIRTVLQGKKV